MVTKILKFQADWCKPCKNLSETLEIMKEDLKDVEIQHIDVDNDDEGLTDKYGIRSIPTMVFLDEDNKEVIKLIGNQTKIAILEALKK